VIIGLCERFHCLPSQLYAEDAEFFRLLNIHRRGNPGKNEEVSGPYDDE
jgi:hypothetical protein